MRKTVVSLIGIVILFLVVGMISASAYFDIVGECPDKFDLMSKLFPETDRNGDGYVCVLPEYVCTTFPDGTVVCKWEPKVAIDNNVHRVVVGECPDKFTLSDKATSLFPETDRNGDGYVCVLPEYVCTTYPDGTVVCKWEPKVAIDNNVKPIDK